MASMESKPSEESSVFPGLWKWLGLEEYRFAPEEAFYNEVYDITKRDPGSNLPETPEDASYSEDGKMMEDIILMVGNRALAEKVYHATLGLMDTLSYQMLQNRFSN